VPCLLVPDSASFSNEFCIYGHCYSALRITSLHNFIWNQFCSEIHHYIPVLHHLLEISKVRWSAALYKHWDCTGRTAHRGRRGIALFFLDDGTRRGEGSASCPGRSSPSGKNRYPLYRRLCGPQGRSGQVRKISPPTGIRSPDRPARSQFLYRLSYPGLSSVETAVICWG